MQHIEAARDPPTTAYVGQGRLSRWRSDLRRPHLPHLRRYGPSASHMGQDSSSTSADRSSPGEHAAKHTRRDCTP
jgi:hypothetical protein